jgi:chromosome segregation ATPase
VAAEKVEQMRRTEQLQDLRKKLQRKQNLSKRLEKLLTESQRISHAKVANLTRRLTTADRLVSTLQQERTMLSKAIIGNASQAAELQERSDNLSRALHVSQKKVAALLGQRSVLEKDLVGNRTIASHLSESVRVLKKKVEDGTNALVEAKRAAEHAEAEKEGAEAVAKQLQGTVPQLLANAQAANERVETERVLRQRESLLAAQAREALKARMTSDVQRQLEKLSVVVPKLDAASNDVQQGQALATDLSDDVSDVLEQAAGEQDKSPAKQLTLASRRVQDGRGLARLLGSALGSDDGAQSKS